VRKHPLHSVVRTPHGVVFEQDVDALRVPTESGQVGLRPRGEPTVLSVEPGLAIARAGETRYFLGTTGGLLTTDGADATLLTALAITGTTAEAVLAELEAALAAPNAELAVRAAIDRLESGILRELQRERRGGLPIRLKETV